MTSEDFFKRVDELQETICCLGALEEEALKLYCLIHQCKTSVHQNGEDFISRQYLIEKVTCLINGIPIILDTAGKSMFCRLKISEEKRVALACAQEKECI